MHRELATTILVTTVPCLCVCVCVCVCANRCWLWLVKPWASSLGRDSYRYQLSCQFSWKLPIRKGIPYISLGVPDFRALICSELTTAALASHHCVSPLRHSTVHHYQWNGSEAMSVGLNDTRPFPTTHPSPKETERSLFLILCSQLELA